ncbi:SUMF1/EgtB/PvdO family nonheme iron enzyme [Pontiella sulfatireligans]|uniref:Gluconolactonase n=1 Tax=Pontiella sulfatireligans TaxID=2750658 RepID=A0A6C2UTV2_9BACT|nr:SUMF1/EgtB/PvdO family nonheme iron enzyme [Pontiella sulfatireligans]VGO23393.1 Gluconolactonase [Pontiella sulfatireligans]
MKTLISVALIATSAWAAPETVLILGGSFEMGDHHDLGGREHRNDELPIRTVQVAPFHIGKYEVTTAEYCAFLNGAVVVVRDGLVFPKTGKAPLCDTRLSSEYSRIGFDGKQFKVLDGKENHPMTGVRWAGAAAYCDWLSDQQNAEPRYRLPTEEEWEYAGRGGRHNPYCIFPWGDDDNPARANWPNSGDPFEKGKLPYTTPVGYYDGSNHDGYQTLDGSNGYGLHDMAGNVWEWCSDLYSQSSADPDIAKPMPDGKDYHVLRSGNWFNGEWGHSRVSNRNPGYFRGPQDPNHPYYHIGLRIARSAADLPLIAGELQILGDNFQFTEGPASDGESNVYFTDIRANRIHVFPPSGKLEVFRENSGGANGLYFDRDGNLLVCEGMNGKLTSISPNGDVAVLADEYNGKGFNKPNDLWIDPKGGVYFTDPIYGRTEKKQDGEHVYYLLPDRSKVIRVIDDFTRPNGLIGTSDGKTLYVADHGASKIWKYAVNADGTLTGKTFFADCSSDGMTIDSQGNIYATQDSVLIFSPDGEQISEIKTPARPTNVTFGGKGNRTLFITARTHLCAIQMNIGGTTSVSSTRTQRTGQSPSLQQGKRPQGRPDKPWLLEHAKELDENGDGAVARKEMLDEAEKAFKLYDKNNNGELASSELKGKGMAKSAMGGFIKLHAEELDSNSDGTITQKEMLDETAKLFDKSDKNRDGKVDAKDQSRRTPQSSRPQGGGNRFAEMDSNKDGAVSLKEFVAQEKKKKGQVDESRARQKFEQIDKDGNGKLSQQEVENAPKGKGGRK